MTREPILFAAAARRGQSFARAWPNGEAAFCCILAHTDTCLVPGLSEAGISLELRPRTPAADAEVVRLGAARCLPRLPSHPLGAAGPAGITRAALGMAGLEATFVGAGLRTWPATDCARLSAVAGASILSGAAVPDAAALFEAGLARGHQLALRASRIILGESVPGGTTTALALLLALGYAADGRVSGSTAGNAHELKSRVAHQALRAAGLEVGSGRADPLGAAGQVGDPMQPIAAGLALAAVGAGATVLLAGGSQMIGVAALIAALAGPGGLERMAIGTTRWVVQDPAAAVAGLAADISADLALLAANLDFSQSRHPELRAYERWLVKEGVGAGGACIAALLATGRPIEDLEADIDAVYGELLGRLHADPA